VLPTFVQQIAIGGPVTITHRDVTRYFLTIPEAVRLVLQAGAIGEDGEIMILDMGEPVKINDLAQRLIQQAGKPISIEYTGLREGEKLHEVLIATSEIGVTRQHEKISHTVGPTDLDISAQLSEELAQKIGSVSQPVGLRIAAS
jgi:FlaA1/EpsC-like NDP-sugar epimerase